jgi:hypothetical protein
METRIEETAPWYFNMVASDPNIIRKALATSLENSVQIFISQADKGFVTMLKSSRPPVRFVALGDIIYTCRNTVGESQVIQVLDAETRQSKYSAFASMS